MVNTNASPKITALLILFTTTLTYAQQYVSQQGRLLDANNRVGSFGLNTMNRYDPLIPRVNDYITGNVTGGSRFQGLVPYRSVNEFGSNLGSSNLSNFRRDSVGQGDLSLGIIQPRPYVDYSRGVTQGVGGTVIDTGRVYGTPATSGVWDQSSRAQQAYTPMRPLTRSYSALDISSGAAAWTPQEGASTQSPPAWLGGLPTQLTPAEELGGRRGSNAAQLQEPTMFGDETAGQDTRADDEQRTAFEQAQTDDDAALSDPGTTAFEKALAERQATDAGQATPDGGFGGSDATLGTDDAALGDDRADLGGYAAAMTRTNRPEASVEGEQEGLAKPEQGGLNGPRTMDTTKLQKQVAEQRRLSAERSQRRYVAYMQMGRDLLQKGEYYRAATAFSNAAVFGGDEPKVLLAQSHALLGAGEFMTSAYYLTKTLAEEPGLLEDTPFSSAVLPNSETLTAQIADLQVWYDQSHEPMLLFMKGYVEYRLGQYEQASKTLKGIRSEFLTEAREVEAIALLSEAVEAARR